MGKRKDVTIKAVEVSADDELGITIDAENHNTRALDPSQIAMLSITPEDQKPEESTPENKLMKFPTAKFSASAMFPIDYLLNCLKIAKKSGSSHVRLFVGNNQPIAITWNFEAIGKPREDDPAPVRNFEAVYFLAPRIDGDYSEPRGSQLVLPPRSRMLMVTDPEDEKKEEIKEEAKP